jgi:hypothetical protein
LLTKKKNVTKQDNFHKNLHELACQSVLMEETTCLFYKSNDFKDKWQNLVSDISNQLNYTIFSFKFINALSEWLEKCYVKLLKVALTKNLVKHGYFIN